MTPKHYYGGNGCRIHPDCFTCPLEKCIYDTGVTHPQPAVNKARGLMNATNAKALRDEGYTTRQIAEILKVTYRTALRYFAS